MSGLMAWQPFVQDDITNITLSGLFVIRCTPTITSSTIKINAIKIKPNNEPDYRQFTKKRKKGKVKSW